MGGKGSGRKKGGGKSTSMSKNAQKLQKLTGAGTLRKSLIKFADTPAGKRTIKFMQKNKG